MSHAATKHGQQPVQRMNAPNSPRLIAVQQLLRIDQEGAFTGLVSGSVSASRLIPTTDQDNDNDDIDDESSKSLTTRWDIKNVSFLLCEYRTVLYMNDKCMSKAVPGHTGGVPNTTYRLLDLEQDQRVQRAVKDLVSGTTRWRRRLDFIISQLTNRSSMDLDPAVLQVLRLAIYELCFRDLPAHAISEHVGLSQVRSPIIISQVRSLIVIFIQHFQL